MKHLSKFLLVAILFIGFGLRLYKLTTPLADWHSWRQADTASVALEYVKHGIDLLHPKYLDLSSIPSGKYNPEGYRMVEFPLVSALVALIHTATKTWHNLPIHVTYRLVNSLFSMFSALLLYGIVAKLSTKRIALIATAVFTFLPYNIFYSRTVLPEVSLVLFCLLTIYLWLIYRDSGRRLWLLPFALAAALSFLIKPTAIFFFLPLLTVASITPLHLLVAAATALPFLAWRWWIGQYPEGIPAFTWLLNGNGIRFKGAFFRWLFGERIGNLILGYWGLVPLGFGLVAKTKTNFFIAWALSMLLYLTIFATGNVQHDYYQIVLVPIISILVALGTNYLLSRKSLVAYSLLTFSLILMMLLSGYKVKEYYNINNPDMIEAGQAVDRLTPPDALIIAPYQGDTAFLYQTNRRGWPIGANLEMMLLYGADYYVSTALDEQTQSLMKIYPIVTQTEKYILLKLTR